MYVVGIDPQITIIAICIQYREEGDKWKKIAWFQVLLKRKDAYVRVADWEKYMVEQCIRTVDEIAAIIQNHNTKDHNPQKPVSVECGVEQQRGRVKSIPEACLITAAKKMGWNIHVPHPSSWKKAISFYNTKEPTHEEKKKGTLITGNKENKKRAEELYAKELHEYCASKKIVPPKIIHHLCDAACIAKYLQGVEH
jgi:hypothetical protein